MTNRVEHAAKNAGHSRTAHWLIVVGLVAYGIVHLLVGWIAVQVAWGGKDSGDEASQQGALAELASSGPGRMLPWIMVVGMAALVIWQVSDALWGHHEAENEKKRTMRRLGSAGKAVVYALLGFNAAKLAVGSSGGGSGGGGGGDQKEESLTASLMSNGFGRVVVIVIGAVIIGFGVRLVVRGVKKKFTRDLAGGANQTTIRLGQVGFIAKGVALAVVGGLFAWAAISYDPAKAGGLDDALRTVREAPAGSVLLTLLALGIAAFGVYCFAWAKQPKA